MTDADVAQPMPTPIHTTPPPHPNGMWEVSIRLRRSGRGAGRPVKGDTHQVSTTQPLLGATSLINNAHPQHEISTQYLLPALQATAHKVGHKCNQLRMTQRLCWGMNPCAWLSPNSFFHICLMCGCTIPLYPKLSYSILPYFILHYLR
jgi:hypothetical protein